MKKAAEILQSGEIGEPYHAIANYWEAVGYTTFLNEAHFFAGGNWRFDPAKAGGGLLTDGATHWIRPLTTWYIHMTIAVQSSLARLIATALCRLGIYVRWSAVALSGNFCLGVDRRQ